MTVFDLHRHRRLIEIGFWLIFLGTSAFVEALSVITEYGRRDWPLENWEPLVWEFSSALCLGLLIIAVSRLNQWIGFGKTTWRKALGVHLLATIPFSLIHVGGMVALRKLVYLLAGRVYEFGNLPVELAYEYRKDFVTYWLILGIIYMWQHLLYLNAAHPEPENRPPEPLERLMGRKRNREYVFNVEGIVWIEASGNYANVHHKEGILPVRSSMSDLEKRLDSSRFARVHRSFIVNLDRIRVIEPTKSGDHLIHMSDGEVIRFSRRYRSTMKNRLSV